MKKIIGTSMQEDNCCSQPEQHPEAVDDTPISMMTEETVAETEADVGVSKNIQIRGDDLNRM